MLLAGLAVVLPRWLVPAETRSQRCVMLAVMKTAVLLWVLGAALLVAIRAMGGGDALAAFTIAPMMAVALFLWRSALMAMIWGPVLVLVWLTLAQRVERRKGEDLR